MIYVRFKVTICLYLSPDTRARSLSALMATIVNEDTERNAWAVMYAALYASRQRYHSSWTKDIQ